MFLPSGVNDVRGRNCPIKGTHLSDLIARVKVIQFEFSAANLDTHSMFFDFWDFFEANGFMLYRVTPRGSMPIARYAHTLENYRLSNILAVAERIL